MMRILFLLSLAVLLFAACGDSDSGYEPEKSRSTAVAPPPRTLSDEEANQLLNTRCTGCHTLDRAKKSFKDRSYEEWLFQFEQKSCQKAMISPADRASLARWCSRKYVGS